MPLLIIEVANKIEGLKLMNLLYKIQNKEFSIYRITDSETDNKIRIFCDEMN